jgi:hypothetical protein
VKQTGVLVSLRFQIALMISVFGFIKMKYGIEVIIMACRVNASLSTTLINSSKFPLSKSQSVGLDYRALGQIAFRHRDGRASNHVQYLKLVFPFVD